MAGAATTMVRYQNASLYKIDHQCRELLIVSCAATMPQKHAVPCGVDQFIILVSAMMTTRKKLLFVVASYLSGRPVPLCRAAQLLALFLCVARQQ